LRAKGDQQAYDKYSAELHRTQEFAHLIMQTRERLEALYGDERTKEGKLKATKKKREVAPAELRREKQEILARLQKEYVDLKAQWGGISEYDGWFAQQVNNAKLNSVAAYYDLVPGFEHLLELNGGDLEKFYQEAERLSRKPKKERLQWLRTLGHNVQSAQSTGG
jgi:predicted aminopeptidase